VQYLEESPSVLDVRPDEDVEMERRPRHAVENGGDSADHQVFDVMGA